MIKRNKNLDKKQRELLVKIWEQYWDKTVKEKTAIFNNVAGTKYNYSTLVKFYSFYKIGFDDGIERDASEIQLERLGKARANLMLKQKENVYARREFHKIARENVLTGSFKEKIAELYGMKNPLKFALKKPKNNKYVMLVVNSDLQIGRKVDIPNNKYDESVLVKRQEKFLEQVEFYKNLFKIDNFIHLDLGDAIDHNAMRPGHIDDLEKNYHSLAEQYKKWLDFRLETLQKINEWGFVRFAGVKSNHCRMNGNKLMNLKADDFSVLHNDTISRLLPGSELKLNVLDLANGVYHFSVLGWQIYLHHGDKIPGKPNIHKNNWVKHLRTNYGITGKIFTITGHVHHTFLNKEHFGVGSIVGTDEYAISLGLSSQPAQGIVIVSKDNILTIPIYL